MPEKENNSRKEEFILAYGWMLRKASQRRGQLITHCVFSWEQREREGSFQSGTPAHGMVPPTLSVDLPVSINII